MLLLIAVLAIASAAVLFVTYLRRQDPNPRAQNTFPDNSTTHLRPLFAEDHESSTLNGTRSLREVSETLETNRQKKEVDDAIAALLTEPSRAKLVALLASAAKNGEAAVFSEAAETSLQIYRRSEIAGLSGNDMAALLDSHYRALPQTARSSGELFWLKTEIQKLGSR